MQNRARAAWPSTCTDMLFGCTEVLLTPLCLPALLGYLTGSFRLLNLACLCSATPLPSFLLGSLGRGEGEKSMFQKDKDGVTVHQPPFSSASLPLCCYWVFLLLQLAWKGILLWQRCQRRGREMLLEKPAAEPGRPSDDSAVAAPCHKNLPPNF